MLYMKKKAAKLMRMENLRRIVQILALLFFLTLFFQTIGKYNSALQHIALPTKIPIDLFFRTDALLAIASMLSTRMIIPGMLFFALPLILVAVFAGRFFCGWICPMGTTIDITDKIFFHGVKKQLYINPHIKYYILISIIVASIFSSQIAYLFDPIAILTRSLTLSVFPVMQIIGNTSFAHQHLMFFNESIFNITDSRNYFALNYTSVIILLLIVSFGYISRRFWCRNLCPLGALYAILSKASMLRRLVNRDCISCNKCIPDCKMNAILEDPVHYNAAECIYCYSCTNTCPTLSTRIVPTLSNKQYHSNIDLKRRHLLQAIGIGAGFALLGSTNISSKYSKSGKIKVSSEFLIRPPGSIDEASFVDRCIRCSECMKVCPTGGLQPAITEASVEGLWTPVLVPRIGECTRNCNLCSQVCATQAIKPIDIDEKPHLYIGSAVIDRSKCIVWNSGKHCLMCAEYCSYGAVYTKSIDGINHPYVDTHRCVGCGMCENACPIQPKAAIRVFSFGDKRYMTREQQKDYRDQAIEDNSDLSY